MFRVFSTTANTELVITTLLTVPLFPAASRTEYWFWRESQITVDGSVDGRIHEFFLGIFAFHHERRGNVKDIMASLERGIETFGFHQICFEEGESFEILEPFGDVGHLFGFFDGSHRTTDGITRLKKLVDDVAEKGSEISRNIHT